MTHSSSNSVNGGIPLKNLTGKTFDVFIYSMANSGSRIMMVYLLVNLGCDYEYHNGQGC